MNFSLILNTRKRIELLDNLINSALKNAACSDDVEFLIRFDDDDLTTESFLKEKSLEIKNIILNIGPRPTNLHHEMNQLAKIGRGNYFFILNDDCQILTQNWDKLILDTVFHYKLINRVKDNIFLIKTKDDSVDKCGNYSSFPIFHKDVFAALGFLMYEQFCGLGGDTTIHKLFESVGRIVESDLKINHILHASLDKVIHCDDVAAHMRANTKNNYVDPFTFDVSKQSKILKDYITAAKQNS